MSEIKSQKALRYILSPESCDTGSIGMIRAVALAEQEAEERHEQQLQELRDRAVEAFREICPIGHPSRAENVGLKSHVVCPNVKIIGFPCSNNVECPFISAFARMPNGESRR